MTELDDATYTFSELLEELELEYATDHEQSRLVIPTHSSHGIVVEFVGIGTDETSVVCAVLILPLLQEIHAASADALRAALEETAGMLLGKLVVDQERRALEVRHEMPLTDLTAPAVSVILGALSMHSAIAERMELVFGGRTGPSYDELLLGA